MFKIKRFFFLLGLVSLCTACQKAGTRHDLAELLSNTNNRLALTLETQPDLRKYCELFEQMDSTALLKLLAEPDPKFLEVAYALHYLANRYFQAGDFERGYACMEASALHYLQPMSLLKLAQIALTEPQRMHKDFPQLKDFKQDPLAAYVYVHRCVDLLAQMMDVWASDFEYRYVFSLVSKPARPFMDWITGPEWAEQLPNQATLQTRLTRELTEQRALFQELYAKLKTSEQEVKPLPKVLN